MLLLALLTFDAGAQTSGSAEEAEITFLLGANAYGSGSFDEALAHFLASNRLAPNPSVAFNIARCYARTRRYAEAFRWFNVAAEGLSDKRVQAAIASELAEITPLVVVYDITSEPAGSSVYIDRKDLGVVGVTPIKLALAARGEARTFIFEREGHQDKVVEGLTGKRGEALSVKAELTQIVGTLSVQAVAGTTVHLGAPTADVLCTAPCEGKLAPGNWVLYFRREGHRDAVRQIEIAADQTQTVLVELQPNTGSLVVDASERGARVEIDGVVVGFTPTVVNAVAVGERLVRVSRPGYEATERVVTVDTDKQTALSGVQLQPINEVTAVSRRAERVELAPSSVTIVSREELSAFQYPNIYESLRGVRGVSLTYDSIYGSAAIRGLGQANDFGNRLLLLADGATLNDNILYQSFIWYDGRVDLGGIDRVEIVRGPGSVLYGTGAVSGVVNLVSEPLDAPEGTEFSLGTYNNTVARARAQTHYKWSDRSGFRASLSGAVSQGRVEILDPRGPEQDLTVPGFDQFNAATTIGRVWLGDATVQWYHGYRTQQIPTGVYDTVLLNVNQNNQWIDNRSLVEARYEPKLTETVSLLTRAYFNRYQYDGVLPYGSYRSVEKYVGMSFGGELRTVIEPSTRFRVNTGVQGDTSPVVTLVGDDRFNDGTTANYLDESQPYSIAAAYLLTDIIPVDAVRLTLGGRGDYWSTFGVAFSPRAALVLLPTQTDTVKLLAGRAFRAPSIFELSYNIPGIQIKPPEDELQAENVWSGEVEYTHKFSDQWSVLGAGHASVASNLIETVAEPTDPNAITYRNSELGVRILGGDLEVTRRFQAGWMFTTFYSLLDSRYEDGAIVPNAPLHNAGLKLIVPVSAPTLRVAFRSSLEAPRRIDLTRDDTTGWAIVSDVVASGTVPERGFDYSVGLYNLFDMAYAQPLGDTLPFRTMPQQGRSLMLNLGVRF